MSTFATFLTNLPYSRRRRNVKINLNGKFLRESNKHFPKVIKPKVNINVKPVLNYMNNEPMRKKDATTMEYKGCSQMIPTVGMSNLIFYDCNEQDTYNDDDSMSQQQSITSRSAAGRCFEKTTQPNVHSASEWMAMNDSLEKFVCETNRTLVKVSEPDLTLTSDMPISFMAADDAFLKMDLDYHQTNITDVSIPIWDDLSFGALEQDSNENRLSNTFEMKSASHLVENISSGTADLNETGFCSELNEDTYSSDWHMKSAALLHNDDESMAKFDVSEWNDTAADSRDSYYKFIPLDTSTPLMPRRNADTDVGYDLKFDDEYEFFSNRRCEDEWLQSAKDFTFSGMFRRARFY